MNGKTVSSIKTQKAVKPNAALQRLMYDATLPAEDVLRAYHSGCEGIANPETVERNREDWGSNLVDADKHKSFPRRLAEAFVNPFTAILTVLAAVSFVTDVVLPSTGEQDFMTIVVILTMVLLSGVLRFVQETRSNNAAGKLTSMVRNTTAVLRQYSGKQEIPMEDVVVGDIVLLAAGDMVPADCRIIKAKDLFISQSAVTGESEPVEKTPHTVDISDGKAVTECSNLAFMGSNVISGSAEAVVILTGNQTLFGGIARSLDARREPTGFEKGISSVSWLLIRFMLVMVPIVFVINGITKDDWMEALLFAISIAVGLTPEMLPMIVTTCLARGAVAMSRKKTIIKNLSSIQNLGSMNVLCTDKTGTLTRDKVILERHLDIHGTEDVRVLAYAFLNSFYQTGLKNLMDISIIERTNEESASEPSLRRLSTSYAKIDEIPFDFERRRMSVVVTSPDGGTTLITKGAVEEMLSVCRYAEYRGEVIELTDTVIDEIRIMVEDLNDDGMRVIAIARKSSTVKTPTFSVADESDMVLMGYLAFLDPPKESAQVAIAALNAHGVNVKILTGDNDLVTSAICRQVGMKTGNIVLGSDVEDMDDATLSETVEKTDVFAKLSPQQKARIVSMLRENGHVVGYMGDGINDASAMKASDVGISVDTAVDIAKESADVILLEKDLIVLEQGVVEGRKTYGNMIKYIKMTTSSNFGNMFSVLAASIFLPFLPMAAVQIILLNLIYDCVNVALPWDNVDRTELMEPKKWEASSIGRFMLHVGPVSSIYDIVTFLLMFFVICPAVVGGPFHTLGMEQQILFIALFQAGWFIESMWSQTLIMQMIRTPHVPFIESRASMPVILASAAGIALTTFIPYTAFGAAIGLSPLPGVYFAWLFAIIAGYVLLVEVVKVAYIRKYHEWL